MRFDTSSLMMAGSITTALSGLLLLGMWTQSRRTTAMLWWFAANIVYAASIALLAVSLPNGNVPLIVIGSATGSVAVPLVWLGAAAFQRQRTPVRPALLATGAWLAIVVATAVTPYGSLIGLAGWVIWLTAAAVELWRGRAEHIPARWPLIGVLLIHAVVYAGGVYDVLSGSFPLDGNVPIDSWFGAIFFEGIAYAMASAILMALMCKERETQAYMRAARQDPLTGVANHGALLQGAGRLFERCRRDGAPFSLIMFDLDHFKAINDRFGHRAGDEILRGFADGVRKLLRPTDLFGRYGGEEFTIVLAGATIETARVIAERVRSGFAGEHRFLHGQPLNATVSAGVAEAGAAMTFEDTLDAADRALYAAKRSGRDRVELADRPAAGAVGAIARIA